MKRPLFRGSPGIGHRRRGSDCVDGPRCWDVYKLHILNSSRDEVLASWTFVTRLVNERVLLVRFFVPLALGSALHPVALLRILLGVAPLRLRYG